MATRTVVLPFSRNTLPPNQTNFDQGDKYDTVPNQINEFCINSEATGNAPIAGFSVLQIVSVQSAPVEIAWLVYNKTV